MSVSIAEFKAAKRQVRKDRPETRRARRAHRKAEAALAKAKRKGASAETIKTLTDQVALLKVEWLRELEEDRQAIAKREDLRVATAAERRERCQEQLLRVWAGIGDALEVVAAVASATTPGERVLAGVGAVLDHPDIPLGEDDRDSIEAIVGAIVKAHDDGAE